MCLVPINFLMSGLNRMSLGWYRMYVKLYIDEILVESLRWEMYIAKCLDKIQCM